MRKLPLQKEYKTYWSRTCFEAIWSDILAENDSASELEQHIRPLIPALNPCDSDGFTILHLIVFELHGGDLKAELQTDTAAIDKQDAYGRTALMWAAVRGDARSVLTLLNAGADPNIVDNNGQNMLSAALGKGRALCAFILLKHGVDAAELDPWGQTTLHSLANSQLSYLTQDTTPSLIQIGDGISRPKTNMLLPVPDLAKFIVKELLDHGVNIDAGDYNGNT